MDWQVIWTTPAAADFEQILRAIAIHSLIGSEALRIEILEAVELLERLPRIGSIYERDRTGRTREFLCRRSRIIYRVIEDLQRVEILTVRHSARREPKLPD